MNIDERGRRAAAAIREAVGAARFTVGEPGTRRGLWARSATVLVPLLVLAAIGVPMIWLTRPAAEPGDAIGPTLPGATVPLATTTEPPPTTTTTSESPATTLDAPEGKTPAATLDDLITQTYAAVNAKDTDALRALSADDAWQYLYWSDGQAGSLSWRQQTAVWNLDTDPYRSAEILGEPVVSGNVVAVPARTGYADAAYVGFDVFISLEVAGGYLEGDVIHFMGVEGIEADQAAFLAIIETERAAWNAGNADGVLATMADDAMLWLDATDPDTRYSPDAVRNIVAGPLWFEVETTGDPVFAGLFAAVPTRILTATDSRDGLTIYWIRDRAIALQAFVRSA